MEGQEYEFCRDAIIRFATCTRCGGNRDTAGLPSLVLMLLKVPFHWCYKCGKAMRPDGCLESEFTREIEELERLYRKR